jgi:subtilisin family serine protease
MPSRSRNTAPILVLLAIAGAVALLVAAGGHGSRPSFVQPAHGSSWRSVLGGAHPQAALGQRVLVVLNAPSLAGRVAQSGGRLSDADERRFTAAAHAAQQQLLFELAAKGVVAHPDYRFTRVLNGFSAALDSRAVALLERAPQVKGVYPIRAAYPASTSRGLLSDEVASSRLWSSSSAPLGGFDGRGVTIALLDTGVDRSTPFLHGHVLAGIDVVGRRREARIGINPHGRDEIERHGTEMAGLIVGSGGPAGLAGTAPQATLLPIRVAGWQPDAEGSYAVYARTDQIIAGLEKAVDPNGDGDAHDAASIALIPLVEPFAAFADGPLARAIRGALRLDSLVVAAAGNDGEAGPSFGSVGGPGGVPDALTVGAADLRGGVTDVPLVVRAGLDVLLRRRVPLAGAVTTRRRLQLDVARVSALLDRHGFSRIAGRALLVAAGGDPRRDARRAAAAGASAVLLAGDDLPAGSLGVDDRITAPVIGVPAALVRQVTLAIRRGDRVTVSIGRSRVEGNGGRDRVADFSSRGLAFDARPKPDLVAAGVGLATADPGTTPGGRSRFVTVSGSSAAAATVAGAAALVLQARPALGATELRGVLVGSARRLAEEPFGAQGAGRLDPGAAAAAELAAAPASISFGRGGGDGWHTSRAVLVRNVSTRPLTVYAAPPRRRQPQIALDVRPRRFTIPAGGAASLALRAHVVGLPRAAASGGLLTLAPVGGAAVRIPWGVVVDTGKPQLLGAPSLSAASFRPSETSPALLSIRIGQVLSLQGRPAVQPVLVLDVELRDGSGKRLGLLAEQRDVLPGHYTFGLTGRAPGGKVLRPGQYRLRLVAWPTAGGRPSVRSVAFRIQ